MNCFDGRGGDCAHDVHIVISILGTTSFCTVLCAQLRPCKGEILPLSFDLFHVVSPCVTVDSPRGQRQDWRAEEDPAEGAAAHCFLQRVQLAVCSRRLSFFFIYFIIVLQYDSQTTRIWLADSFFRRFVVTQMFSFPSGGQWTVCIFLSFCLHLSISEVASYQMG